MTIILILCIPLAFAAGGYIAFKGVQLGLRWNSEAKEGRAPSMESPVAQAAGEIRSKSAAREANSILDEWFNGAKE